MPAKKAPAKKVEEKGPTDKQKLDAILRLTLSKLMVGKDVATKEDMAAANALLDVLLLIQPSQQEIEKIVKEESKKKNENQN